VFYSKAQTIDVDSVSNVLKLDVVDSLGEVSKSYRLFNDSLGIHNKLLYIKDSLINLGYLNPEIKSIDSSAIVIEMGERYKWLDIRVSQKDKELLNNQDIYFDDWQGKYISPAMLSVMSSKILDYMDDNGYPFAYVNLDSILFIGKDSISTKLSINSNRRFYFDTIKVISKVDLSTKFLENYLEIKKNDVFSMKKVKSISEKISNLSFVELKKSPKIVFLGSEASVLLALKSRKVNRFDFLVGLLPDKSGVSKFNLTGEIKTELVNRLGKGERLYFKYKNLSKGKQDLKLEVNYPYIMDMPFGFDSKFSIYINDKSYRDVKLDLGVQYLFKGMNYLKTYWSLFSSRLIGVDSTTILGTLRLPDKLDVQTNSIGLKLNYSTLDYKFNAKRGFNMILDGNIGQRKILKNQQIIKLSNENIDFVNSYDSLKLTSYQFNIFADFSYYISLSRNLVFRLGNTMSWKKSEVDLYQNELYKIGGNKLLRGFDEESVFGDLYNVSSAEMRLLIDRNSFLFAFFDYATVHNPFQSSNIWDQPYGFGAGINFDTKGGVIKLSTAVGSQQNNPIDFKDVKIHIGYVSLF